MAKENEHSGGGKKKPKLHLVSIHSHRVRGKDGKVDPKGGFVHEHYHEDDLGNRTGPHYGGVSTNMDDLQQHMQDHFGGTDATQAGDGAPGGSVDAAPEAGAAPPAQEPQ